MPEQTYRVRPARWEADRAALRSIRERVFVHEQGVPLALEWDGKDAAAWHVLAEDPAGHPLGTARLLPDGQIGRMAVLPQWRCRGVGTALLQALLREADTRQGMAPYLNAQRSALEFYVRFGFVARGPEFTEAGIPHRRMVRPPRGGSTSGVVPWARMPAS
jgi:predicted GNAT family N-acyltransferase